MIGRYGIDELYKFLFNLYLILFFPNIFLRNSIITKIEFIILFIAIYRVLSKNIKQRRKENKMFLTAKGMELSNSVMSDFILDKS